MKQVAFIASLMIVLILILGNPFKFDSSIKSGKKSVEPNILFDQKVYRPLEGQQINRETFREDFPIDLIIEDQNNQDKSFDDSSLGKTSSQIAQMKSIADQQKVKEKSLQNQLIVKRFKQLLLFLFLCLVVYVVFRTYKNGPKKRF